MGTPFALDVPQALLVLALLAGAMALYACVRGIAASLAEAAALRAEAEAIFRGDVMPAENTQCRLQRAGRGLRLKLTAFTVVIVTLAVAMVSTPLYIQMSRSQRTTLIQGLWDRSAVLLEGIVASARLFLPSNDVLELGYLPAQSAAIPEAHWVTITAYGAQDKTHNDYVWATNDPNILAKIDTDVFRPGRSRLTDALTPEVEAFAAKVNETAGRELGAWAADIAALTREALSYSLDYSAATLHRIEDIQTTTRSLEERIETRLAELGAGIHCYPPFSEANYRAKANHTFILYKPVLFRQGESALYFRGLVRLEVSIDSIVARIRERERETLAVIILIAIAAILIGGLAAMALATLIIHPIKRLVSHLEMIRDTEDKTELAGRDIVIKSGDEIGMLGETVNDMLHGLVKAAMAAQDLSIGKEIQKKFIPLELDEIGNKRTSGYKRTNNVEFFGYYEGAKGVSGDYFDYRDLGGRFYAIIKCDVAGKGVPAALIMAQVATMFINFFDRWQPTEQGMRIDDLVYRINSYLESLAFKGRFAAFSLCLFDSVTGLARFCNAGDNLIHWYDHSKRKMQTFTLPASPAAGVLTNEMIASKGGYTVQTLTLDHGDILFLYSDGIEEAKRKFRDRNFNAITCSYGATVAGPAPAGTVHGSHVTGQDSEELGPARIEALQNAVMNRTTYELYKYHNPQGEVLYHFDFTKGMASVEEVIMAMVSVEKIFRLCKRGDSPQSRVLVDRRVDAFLREYFVEYAQYIGKTQDYPEDRQYVYYVGVEEDEQYDDLTILGVRRR